MINMSKVFLIGNVKSRIGFDISGLKNMVRYGCNCTYRIINDIDVLAVDNGIIHEI